MLGLSTSGHVHPRRHVTVGTLGSLLIMVGSWGVGWLPSNQLSWFAHSTILNPLRVETSGVISCAVAMMLGCLLLIRSWLRLGQDLRLPTLRIPPSSIVSGEPHVHARRYLSHAMIAWMAPLMLAFPIFSRDVYSYLAQGRVLHTGLNPYEHGVSSLSGWFMQGADSIWAESPSPYGPLFLLMARGIWVVTGGVPEAAILIFRLITVSGLVLCWWAVPRLARRFGSNQEWALWVAVLNPLTAFYLMAGVHNDSLMTGLLLAGFLLIGAGRDRWGASTAGLVLIGVSIAIKPLTVLTLPFAGLLMLYRPGQARVRYRHRAAAWVWCLVVVGAVMTVAGAVSGLWFGWIPAMLTSGDAAFPYAPFGLLGLGFGWLVDVVLNTGLRPVADVVYTLGTAASLGLVAYLALRRRVINPLVSTALALTVTILLAPIIQPWYVLWVIPIYAVTRVWRGTMEWQSWTVYLMVVALAVVGVIDQVSVAQWIPILLVRGIILVVGVAGMVYLVLFDRATACLFPFRRDARQAMRRREPPSELTTTRESE
ncbi:polyprenol phosphomannose-dependent alpha 1,6 mannosyltransferase MptB [Citricoccus sp. NR2]|uniref:polyprenol phosphomannose-dependent alpha 1,6 mannosyltransferase MptB n=1 Tax=Citricoccus sp. NR2 TaxID=3004095 RepID=UPI0022DDD8B1|nr:polyprenol phosphomannose-dependent alpha 1,6 mannosyltransferase MptB [Citricoccus sp. NR2]WBL18433.1 polyprenol phosphomannose-dependent alpha 1,6 mannosyltransferase MptB [Citricoccus sp. NR2]